MRAAVIGSGAWGTTLAMVLASNGHEVWLWSHDEAIAREINELHENRTLFPGVALPDNLRSDADLDRVVAGAELIVPVVASQFYAETLRRLLPVLKSDTVLVSATKGLDPATRRRTSEVAYDLLPPELHANFAILSGPNIAREIAERKPATTVIASSDERAARIAQRYFSTDFFRVYTNADVTGVELGGTLKNIIAIAAGIIDGLELGDNTRSALMVRGQVEVMRFGVAHGARPETFYGLAGMGDLITTCSSVMSRNHYVGEHLAKGQTLTEILNGMRAVAEGVETARLVHAVAREKNIEMPVTAEVHAVLFENKPVQDALRDLMTRELKSEQSPGQSP